MLAIAWGCGGQLRASETGGAFAAIHIEGNRASATAGLEPALALHDTAGGAAALDPFVLAQDVERIRTAYLKRGYFGAKVTAQVDAARRVVTFSVVEGVRATA